MKSHRFPFEVEIRQEGHDYFVVGEHEIYRVLTHDEDGFEVEGVQDFFHVEEIFVWTPNEERYVALSHVPLEVFASVADAVRDAEQAAEEACYERRQER